MDESQFPMRLRAPTPQNHAPSEFRAEALAPEREDHSMSSTLMTSAVTSPARACRGGADLRSSAV